MRVLLQPFSRLRCRLQPIPLPEEAAEAVAEDMEAEAEVAEDMAAVAVSMVAGAVDFTEGAAGSTAAAADFAAAADSTAAADFTAAPHFMAEAACAVLGANSAPGRVEVARLRGQVAVTDLTRYVMLRTDR
jgi:hypothetical protein